MDRPSSAFRRKSQVFVEIPPSPFTPARSGGANPRVQQVNTPLKAVAMNVDHVEISSSPSNKLKRKPMGAPHTDHPGEGAARPAKKPKSDVRTAADAGGPKNTGVTDGMRAGLQEETVRCHQCTRQFDPTGVIQCTSLRPNGRRCVLRYCKACLRNRYQENIEDLKASTAEGVSPEARAKHATHVSYFFTCPRCSDKCNCRVCRKAKGLPATGDLNLQARKSAKVHASQDLVPNQQDGARVQPASELEVSVPIPSSSAVPVKKGAKVRAARSKPHASKPKPHVLVPPSPHVKVKTASGGEGAATNQPKRRVSRPKAEAAPKPVPKPVWTRLSSALSHDGALQRLNIREYLLRFAHLTDIARGHLEEFEELGSTTLRSSDSDHRGHVDGSLLVGWVPEPSLKATLIGLLTLLSKDAGMEESTAALTKAIQSIRTSGASLNKMWAALASLRNESSLALPDPLPPVTTATRQSTRSAAVAQDPSGSSIPILYTAQLVPVVGALVEYTLQTKAVREDFERAASQEKDLVRAARELTAEENARWKSSMDTKETTRADRNAARADHKAALSAIEHAQRVAAAECIPRFAPLGRDADGRVYYALTPGIIEREAAVNFLEGDKGNVRLGKRRGVADEAQRKRMRQWSWFVAVWGLKPEGAEVAKLSHDDDDAEDEGEADEDAEGWWGFWQPEEVAKLSEWLAMKHGVDMEAKRTSKEPEDSVAIPVVPVTESDKRRSRPSVTSSAGDSSLAGPSRSGPRTFASMNKDTEDEDELARSATLGSDSDDKDARPYEGIVPPKKHEIRMLAKGLQEYAELLEWRIKRASKDSAKDGAEKEEKEKPEEKAGKSAKGKGVQRTDAISTQTFYGK
ncbi:hypothetical protein C2E23DRAFT_716870 [Lenzites betulinus]|nr:hypothetical protein C2E23DRAFT_716870 [Lenzites betulinus]